MGWAPREDKAWEGSRFGDSIGRMALEIANQLQAYARFVASAAPAPDVIASGGIASITKLGVGLYQIQTTEPMRSEQNGLLATLNQAEGVPYFLRCALSSAVAETNTFLLQVLTLTPPAGPFTAVETTDDQAYIYVEVKRFVTELP